MLIPVAKYIVTHQESPDSAFQLTEANKPGALPFEVPVGFLNGPVFDSLLTDFDTDVAVIGCNERDNLLMVVRIGGLYTLSACFWWLAFGIRATVLHILSFLYGWWLTIYGYSIVWLWTKHFGPAKQWAVNAGIELLWLDVERTKFLALHGNMGPDERRHCIMNACMKFGIEDCDVEAINERTSD